MSTPPAQQPARFKAPSNLSTSERISTSTVGLVALSDFRKRRAEVLEQQEREAREALRTGSGASTPKVDDERSRSATPANEDGALQRKKVKKTKKALVSFGDDEEEEGEKADDTASVAKSKRNKTRANQEAGDVGAGPDASTEGKDSANKPGKIAVNASVGVVPRALTKAALRREAAERERLRKEFLALQEAVKNTEIAIPFVFYDGSSTPGGIVRVRKGEFVWVFLDNCRKVGAERAVGGDKTTNVRRNWARIGVDDLLLVRGTMIIPHHYEFYFFIMNRTRGPDNMCLFDYSAEAPASAAEPNGDSDTPTPATPLSSAKGGINSTKVDINTLEGVNGDPTFTKVIDRRWYERNKHIYPASLWQEFDPEKDYTSEIRRDTGGNTFFFSK